MTIYTALTSDLAICGFWHYALNLPFAFLPFHPEQGIPKSDAVIGLHKILAAGQKTICFTPQDTKDLHLFRDLKIPGNQTSFAFNSTR